MGQMMARGLPSVLYLTFMLHHLTEFRISIGHFNMREFVQNLAFFEFELVENLSILRIRSEVFV